MIEFFEDRHEYLVDGMATPSTTQLMHCMPEFSQMYRGVSNSVLMKKAKYGDGVHECIERVGKGFDLPSDFNWKSYEGLAVKRYLQLAVEHDIHIDSSEQTICYMDDGEPLVAGKYDLLGSVKGERSLIDIKTTAKYDPVYLKVQLSTYKVCLEQMTGNEIDKLYCLWLPKKGLGRLLPVDAMETDKILEKLRRARKTYQRR